MELIQQLEHLGLVRLCAFFALFETQNELEVAEDVFLKELLEFEHV